MSDWEYTEIDCTIIHETHEAYLITTDGENEEWVPKSVSYRSGNTLTLPEHIAYEKGLI